MTMLNVNFGDDTTLVADHAPIQQSSYDRKDHSNINRASKSALIDAGTKLLTEYTLPSSEVIDQINFTKTGMNVARSDSLRKD